MSKPQDIESVLAAIDGAQTRRDLWQVSLDALHSYGVSRVSYHARSGDGSDLSIITDGFDEHWVSRYVSERFYEIDPIPEMAARLAKPFYLHDVPDMVQHSTSVDKYLEALDHAQMGDGLALAVFGPGLKNAFVGLGFDVERLNLTPERIFQLQCIAQAAHLKFLALSEQRSRVARLSQREIDVLRWVARGKSNSVIGDILGISPHTVDAHIRKIYKKLDVADRTSAAIQGLGAGMTQLADNVIT